MKKNIYSEIPAKLNSELTEIILQEGDLRIERIVSEGQSSPPDFWYDQDQSEWVIILQGKARLQFTDKIIELQEGDHLKIPAHCRHRVDWTDAKQQTIWLAIYYI